MVKSYGTITITIIDLAIAYDIRLSNSVIIKDAGGVYTPRTITITGKSQPVGENEQDYTAYFSIEESSDGKTWVTTVSKTAAVSEYNYSYQQKGTSFIRIKMEDEDGNVLSQKVIPVVSEGSQGYTVFLDNDSHTFVGDETSALSGQSVTVSPIVYLGSTEKDVSITNITSTPDGMTSTISTDKKSVTFMVSESGKVSSSGTIDIVFSADGKNFAKKFSYSVALKGQTGVRYDLIATPNIVKIKQDGTFSPSSVTFTSYEVNGSERTPYYGILKIWWTSDNGATWNGVDPVETIKLEDENGRQILTENGSIVLAQDSQYYTVEPKSFVRGYQVRLYPPGTTNITDETDYLDQETVTFVAMGITNQETQYYLSTSSTELMGGSWSSTLPSYNPYSETNGEITKYYWKRTALTYEDGEVIYVDQGLADDINMTLKTTNNYDIALDQQAMLAKLSKGNNGVFISDTDGSLYINATYIKSTSLAAGVLTADKITSGILKSKDGNSYINLDTGAASFKDLTIDLDTLTLTVDGQETSGMSDYVQSLVDEKMTGNHIVTAINADSTSLSISAAKLNFKSYDLDVTTNGMTITADNFKIDSSGNVTMSGKITATDGQIGGYTIGKNYLTGSKVGMGSSSTYYAFWAGNDVASSAPFRVTNSGVLTATSATITGTITTTNLNATGGSIGGFTINNGSLSGGTISAGTISGTQISGGSISITDISGSTITGSTIQSVFTTIGGANGAYYVDSTGFGLRYSSSDKHYLYYMSTNAYNGTWDLINTKWDTHDSLYCGGLTINTFLNNDQYKADSGDTLNTTSYPYAASCYLDIYGQYDPSNKVNCIYLDAGNGRASFKSGTASVTVNNGSLALNGTLFINGNKYSTSETPDLSGYAQLAASSINFRNASSFYINGHQFKPIYMWYANGDTSNTRYGANAKDAGLSSSSETVGDYGNWTMATTARFYAFDV